MLSQLGDCLVRTGVLPAETVRTALERQTVYGGTLDTVLLEMDALDEATLWQALSVATGLPLPEPALLERADPQAAGIFNADCGRRCRAVPLGQHGGRLQLLCADPPERSALRALEGALGLRFQLFVAPELRVWAAAQIVYGQPMPARFLRLLARLLGPSPVRQWTKALSARLPGPATATAVPTAGESAATERRDGTHGRAPRAEAVSKETAPAAGGPEAAAAEGPAPLEQILGAFARAPAVEALATATATATASGHEGGGAAATGADSDEHLCRIALDPAAAERVPALRRLRGRLARPRVQELLARLRDDLANAPGERAATTAGALAELRDAAAVPALLGRLRDTDTAVTQAAHGALVEITKQDFGNSARRWTAWWDRHRDEERVDWLFEGLSHKNTEIRYAASDELRLITGEYFGYHFDLPKREREEARGRWESWWLEIGRHKPAAAAGAPAASAASPAPATDDAV